MSSVWVSPNIFSVSSWFIFFFLSDLLIFVSSFWSFLIISLYFYYTENIRETRKEVRLWQIFWFWSRGMGGKTLTLVCDIFPRSIKFSFLRFCHFFIILHKSLQETQAWFGFLLVDFHFLIGFAHFCFLGFELFDYQSISLLYEKYPKNEERSSIVAEK